MPNLEEAIRECAYHLWIADGQPEGQADIYWLNAQREILTTSVESSGSNAAAAAPADTDLVATKSAKKAKVARSEKSKTRAAWFHASIVRRTRNDDSVISGGSSPAPRCSSKRIEADFQEWQDIRDWTAEKYPRLPHGRLGSAHQLPAVPRSRSAWAKFDDDKPLAKQEAMMRR